MIRNVGFFILFAGLLSAIAMTPARTFPRPPCTDGETAVYKTTFTGKKGKSTGFAAEAFARYHVVEWTSKIHFSDNGLNISRMDKLAGGGRRETEALAKGTGQVRVTSFTDTFISPSGKRESRLEVDFTDPALKFPNDLFPIFALPILLRGAELDKAGVEHEANIYWGPMSFSRGVWKVTGTKKVAVPAGTFTCYEIEARILIDTADGILKNALEKFLPKYYFYLNVEAPHYMVRFQAGVPGGETMTDELVRFTPGK